jgi:hypothetical protein
LEGGFSFFHSDSECAEPLGVSTNFGLFRTFDESPISWNGEGELTSWLTLNGVPTVFEFS